MSRFYLAIPQLTRLGNAKPSEVLGYHAEECWHTHGRGHYRLLDVHANHANSGCPSSLAARSERHTLLKWAVNRIAQEAGCRVNDEPSTYKLLLQQFTPVECQALFPKVPSKAVQKEIDQLRDELKKLTHMIHGPERRAKRLEITNTCRLMHRHHKTKGLRLNLELIDTHSNEARWVDVTSIHPTCKTRIEREMKGVKERIESAWKARREHTVDQLAGERGCAAQDQAALKFNTYAPLLAVAHKQIETKKRTRKPVFLPTVVTTLGEMNKEAVRLQEWIVMVYGRRLLRQEAQDDGIPIKTKTAILRNKFRTAIQMAVAKGTANMILTCGLSKGTLRSSIT